MKPAQFYVCTMHQGFWAHTLQTLRFLHSVEDDASEEALMPRAFTCFSLVVR